MADRSFDTTKFINAAQVGGIEQYAIDDGQARGTRALLVNTGGGLRYRVLLDRGSDIDQAFFDAQSLTFLTHKGPIAPTRAMDYGLDWLRGFPGGLLTSCGPFNIGGPVEDDGEKLGLHGPHSHTPATVESIVQPDPHAGQMEMRIVTRHRYGAFYGPCVELKRTITSTLGSNSISFVDEFTNAGNADVPHAWLLHVNLGYPLCDAGAEFCFDAPEIKETMINSPLSPGYFKPGGAWKKIPKPLAAHAGSGAVVAYLYPRAKDRAGNTTVGVVNKKIGLGFAIHYNTREFPRCGNWQHWGEREYITGIEPMNGTVDGRDKDRAGGLLDTLKAGARKTYSYGLEVVTEKSEIAGLLKLNRTS